MNRCLEETDIPEWVTKGPPTIQKDHSKRNFPNNYRPITCLPIMWKILTAQILREINYSQISRGLFPKKRKGFHKGTRGTEDLRYNDQHILKYSKTRRTTVVIVGIDNKKYLQYNPAKLDNICLKNVHDIHRRHEVHRGNHEKLELTTSGKSLTEVKIQRGIFQGDALSPLLFVVTIMPINHIFRKCTGGHKLHKSQEKINHKMYTDIKLFAKN